MDEASPPNPTAKDPQVDIESEPGEVDMKSFLEGVSIVKVAVGCHKTFALTSDGYVYAWGAFVVSSQHAHSLPPEISRAKITQHQFNRDITVDLIIHEVPTLVIGLRNIASIAAGNDFLLALDSNAEVQRLGVFSHDATVGKIDWFRTRTWKEAWPRKPAAGRPRIVSVHATPMAAFAISKKGLIWAWGDNQSYQLGHLEGKEAAGVIGAKFPNKVVGVMDQAKFVVGSSRVTIAVTKGGQAWIWGSQTDSFPGYHGGEVPRGAETTLHRDDQRHLFLKPARLEYEGVVGAAVGEEHILLVLKDGRLLAWGNNRQGQCGMGWSRGSVPLPQELRIKNLEGRPVKWVAAGGTFSFFGSTVKGAGRAREVSRPDVRLEEGEAMDMD
jgi:alpha-tubulin suppressor-like RCC1 family protein